MQRINLHALRWLVVVGCVSAVELSCVPWLGVAWHWIHNDRITSSGISLSVPGRYFPNAESNGSILMWKHELGFPILRGQSSTVWFFPARVHSKILLSRDRDKLVRVLRDVTLEGVMKYEGERDFQTSLGTIACFAFSGNHGTQKVYCYVDGGGPDFEYDGPATHASTIYEVVTSARTVQ